MPCPCANRARTRLCAASLPYGCTAGLYSNVRRCVRPYHDPACTGDDRRAALLEEVSIYQGYDHEDATSELFGVGCGAGARSSACDVGCRPALQKIVTVEGITEYRLDNGLRVLLFPDHSKPRVTVNLTVFVGSRHEGYGEAGMAHLLEHMVFKGTPSHPNISQALQGRGHSSTAPHRPTARIISRRCRRVTTTWSSPLPSKPTAS